MIQEKRGRRFLREMKKEKWVRKRGENFERSLTLMVMIALVWDFVHIECVIIIIIK